MPTYSVRKLIKSLVIKDDKDDAVTSDAIVDRCCDLIDERGSADFWWEMEADEILKGTGLEGQNLRYFSVNGIAI